MTLRIQELTPEQADALATRLGLSRLPGTLFSAYLHADAARDPDLRPTFLGVEHEGRLWLHGIHRRPIEGSPWWDASSPYGYGGPLCNSADPGFLAAAWRAYNDWMLAHAVVVEYVRFHPMLANEAHYGGTVVPNRSVVWIDVTAPDVQTGYASRLRSTLNKAARLGLQYSERPLADDPHAFAVYYRRAMMEIGADAFFQFSDTYFERLAQHPGARMGVCRGQDSDDWLAACLMLDGHGITEYHLAATCTAGRRAGASSYALHAAALAARARGQQGVYLGGGNDTREDNALLFFKAAFSPLRAAYRTGSHVFNPAAYSQLQQKFPAAWSAYPQRPIFYRKV